MKFSEEIISVFDYLGEKMGIAIDWTSSNVQPFINFDSNNTHSSI